MFRLTYTFGLIGLAFAVSYGADVVGLPAFVGIGSAAILILLAIATAAFSPFSPRLKRSLPSGDPLLDCSVLDAMERLHTAGRPMTARQISSAPDYASIVQRLHEAGILSPLAQPKGEETRWILTPYGRALQRRRSFFSPVSGG